MTATATRALVLAMLLGAPACRSPGPAEPEAPAAPPAPTGESAMEPAPPVKECLLRALGDPARQELFAHWSVEIEAARQPDGSVRVAFSLPVSQTIVADGRLATRLEDEAIFTARSVSYRRRYVKGPGDPAAEMQSSILELRARAVRAVCSGLRDAATMELAVGVMEEPDGFSVLLERIPYTPGGHRIYRVSNSFEVVDSLPGG